MSLVVAKYGGHAMGDEGGFAADVAALVAGGTEVVVVHGGGPQIGALMARVGKVAEFVDGLRVTDADTLDLARMVLVGRVNRDVVSALSLQGVVAVGVSGEDGRLLQATPRPGGLGFVGDVAVVDPTLLRHLLAGGMVPVVATIGRDAGGQAYNINADTAAAALAAALGADALVYLTDVDGIRTDRSDPASRVGEVTTAQLEGWLADGTVAGGMVPKVRGCIAAVGAGVGAAHVVDGRHPHAVLLGDPTAATVVRA